MIRLMIFLILMIVNIYSGSDIKIDAKIKNVTVYKQNALIKKVGNIQITKGRQKLIFTNLSNNLIEESCHINIHHPDVKIIDVLFESKFDSDSRGIKIKAKQDIIDSLKIEIKKNDAKQRIITKQIDFLETVKLGSDSESSSELLSSKNIQNRLQILVDFIGDNHSKLFAEKIKLENKSDQLYKHISKIDIEIRELGLKPTRVFKEAAVIVDCSKTCNVEIGINYLTNNATWAPHYDLKLDEKTKTTTCDFYAKIQQSTGENWEDVNITVSNTDPVTSYEERRLGRWNIDFRGYEKLQPVTRRGKRRPSEQVSYSPDFISPKGTGSLEGCVVDLETGEPLTGANVLITGTKFGAATDTEGRFSIKQIPSGEKTVRVSYIGFKDYQTRLNILERKMANYNFHLDEDAFATQELVVVGASSLNPFVNEVVLAFDVPGKFSVNSDYKYHKTLLSSQKNSTIIEYKTIPKLDPVVLVNAKMVNDNGYMILDGSANLFVGDNFVKSTAITRTLLKDTVAVNYGTSHSIKVERKLVNKTKETSGLFSKTIRDTYKYKITIENLGESEKTVNILDHIPYSYKEEITVELLNPKIEIKKEDPSLKWTLNLKSKEKKEIEIEFAVEYPANKTINGLE